MQPRITHPPKIFMVNWFRKDKDGKFLWPGFGENMRVLKWIVDRARGTRRRAGDAGRLGAARRATSISRASTSRPSSVDAATDIDLDEWKTELESQGEFFDKIGADDARGAQAAARAAPGQREGEPGERQQVASGPRAAY